MSGTGGFGAAAGTGGLGAAPRTGGSGAAPRTGRSGAAPRTGGFGLTSMRQRVESVSGTLEIESEPGGGTGISARVPVEAEVHA